MPAYRFGRCELDSDRHRLTVSGIERHVEPQVFDLLEFLLERAGDVATHDALIESVWRGRVVTDSAISVRINAARKAVGDNGSRQEIIQTVPRRGFRMGIEVERVDQCGSDGKGQVRESTRPVLGVFPFESLSAAIPPYLVRGIAEDIATELSRFGDIEVIAPYSTFRHDFGQRDVFDVARSLGISHVILGTLAGSDTVERVTVRLLQADDGASLWSERYRLAGDDFFDAQDDAVRQIVATLSQGLKNSLTESARRKPTQSLSAYDCLLRGLHIYKWGVANMNEAEQARFWFDRAIELDPDYGRARAWRECVGAYWWSSPPTDAELSASTERINRAVELDPQDHEVHRIKGALHMCCRDHDLGDYHLAKAVELNPNDAHILIKVGVYRSFLARNYDDLTYIDTAFRRNPLHPSWYWQDRAIALFANGRYRETIRNLERCTAETDVAQLYRAASFAQLGEIGRAKVQVERLRATNPVAGIDWLQVAYPTRCYAESEHREAFVDGLRRAGL